MEAHVLIVSGRVQGVGFRWFTEQEARKHRIQGYVRNLPDGRVEIWAQGEIESLGEFRASLKKGPPAARVKEVERKPVPLDESLTSFEVRF